MLLGTLGASVVGNMLTEKVALSVRKNVVRTRREYNNMDKTF